MRLVHRSDLRWGELTGLQAHDIELAPNRIVHVRRAVEQTSSGPPALKRPKNGKTRTTLFPKSLTDDLRHLIDESPPPMARPGCCSRTAAAASCAAPRPNRSGSRPPRLPAGR